MALLSNRTGFTSESQKKASNITDLKAELLDAGNDDFKEISGKIKIDYEQMPLVQEMQAPILPENYLKYGGASAATEDGEFVAVSAYGQIYTDPQFPSSGNRQVIIYKQNDRGLSYLATIENIEPAADDDFFGRSLGMTRVSENIIYLAVTLPESKKLKVYEINIQSASVSLKYSIQKDAIPPSNPDVFGHKVFINPNFVAVSEISFTAGVAGNVYVYSLSSGTQTASVSTGANKFGYSMAGYSNYLFIGSPEENSLWGSIRAYKIDGAGSLSLVSEHLGDTVNRVGASLSCSSIGRYVKDKLIIFTSSYDSVAMGSLDNTTSVEPATVLDFDRSSDTLSFKQSLVTPIADCKYWGEEIVSGQGVDYADVLGSYLPEQGRSTGVTGEKFIVLGRGPGSYDWQAVYYEHDAQADQYVIAKAKDIAYLLRETQPEYKERRGSLCFSSTSGGFLLSSFCAPFGFFVPGYATGQPMTLCYKLFSKKSANFSASMSGKTSRVFSSSFYGAENLDKKLLPLATIDGSTPGVKDLKAQLARYAGQTGRVVFEGFSAGRNQASNLYIDNIQIGDSLEDFTNKYYYRQWETTSEVFDVNFSDYPLLSWKGIESSQTSFLSNAVWSVFDYHSYSEMAESQKLTITGGDPNDQFGYSVSISADGNTAIVGAFLDDVESNENQGSAYVYKYNGSAWIEEQKLTASDGDIGDWFGWSVSISADGNTAIIGAFLDDDKGSDSGSVYVFRYNGSSWAQEEKLTASDGDTNDTFGNSVSISADGNTVIAGAYLDDVESNENQGSAYIFKYNGSAWVEEQKLIASNGAASDRFGFSVSISADGNTAIVGADQESSQDFSSGAAYIFRYNGLEWVEEQKLIASDGDQFDYFGRSVSICTDGNAAIVGANGDDVGSNTDQGSAYVFRYNGYAWVEEQKLIASDGAASDQFGKSVSISADGSAVIVGSYGDDISGQENQGSAYVYKYNGSAWIEEQKLTASDGDEFDRFGYSVSISADGNEAVVGAYGSNSSQGSSYIYKAPPAFNDLSWQNLQSINEPVVDIGYSKSVSISADGSRFIAGADLDNIGSNTNQGSAYVYKYNGSTWEQEQKLTALDGEAGDRFGSSVSMSADGNTVIIGASEDRIGSNSAQGSAYVFRYNGISWAQEKKLIDLDGAQLDIFGYSVSISADGNTVIVGSYRDNIESNTDQGSAFVFRYNGSDWIQDPKITASDGAPNDLFGNSVSISADGNTAIVTAVQDDSKGSAYIFRYNGSEWIEEQKLPASDVSPNDFFGRSASMSADGNTVIAGAIADDVGSNTDQGSAYVFRYNGYAWVEEQKLIASDGAASDQFGKSVSISADGNTAIVGAILDDDAGLSSGSAYIFKYNGFEWIEEQKLNDPNGNANDKFGNSLSMSADGNTAIIGNSPATSNTPEKVYIYGQKNSQTRQISPQNLLSYSYAPKAVFDEGLTLASNQLDPYGENKAILATESALNIRHALRQNVVNALNLTYYKSKTFIFSVHLKKGPGVSAPDYVFFGTNNDAGNGTTQCKDGGILVNVSDGTTQVTSTTFVTARGSEDLGNGWYRFWFAMPGPKMGTDTSSESPSVHFVNNQSNPDLISDSLHVNPIYVGNINANLYVFGWQVEIKDINDYSDGDSIVGPYTETNESPDANYLYMNGSASSYKDFGNVFFLRSPEVTLPQDPELNFWLSSRESAATSVNVYWQPSEPENRYDIDLIIEYGKLKAQLDSSNPDADYYKSIEMNHVEVRYKEGHQVKDVTKIQDSLASLYVTTQTQLFEGQKSFADSAGGFLETSSPETITRFSPSKINIIEATGSKTYILDSSIKKGQQFLFINNSNNLAGSNRDENAVYIFSTHSLRKTLARLLPGDFCQITALQDMPQTSAAFAVSIKRKTSGPVLNFKSGQNIGFAFKDVAWSEKLGLFAGAGDGGIATSHDGINWTVQPNTSGNWEKIIWAEAAAGEGWFIAIDSTVGSSTSVKSSDGSTWTNYKNPLVGRAWIDIVWAKDLGQIVFLDTSRSVTYTYDDNLSLFLTRSLFPDFTVDPTKLLYVKEKQTFYVFSSAETVFSSNLASWTSQGSNLDPAINNIIWSPKDGAFFGLKDGSASKYKSTDSYTWSVMSGSLFSETTFKKFEWNEDLQLYTFFSASENLYVGAVMPFLMPYSLGQAGAIGAWSNRLHMWAGSNSNGDVIYSQL